MPRAIVATVVVAFWGLLVGGCRLGRSVPPNDYRLHSRRISIDQVAFAQKEWLQHELSRVSNTPPNRKVLGFPYALALYNLLGKKQKGILKNLTETPVLFSTVDTTDDLRRLHRRLADLGYFQARIHAHIRVLTKQRVLLTYNVVPGTRRRIGHFDLAPTGVARFDTLLLAVHQRLAAPRSGQAYQRDKLRSYQHNIAEALRNEGYFYLRPEHFYFEADTAQTAELHLRLRTETPPTSLALQAQRIGDLFFYYGSAGTGIEQYRAWNDGQWTFRGSRPFVAPAVLRRNTALRTGQYYSWQKQQATQRYLSHLPMVEQVRIVWQASDTLPDALDGHIFLSPAKRYALSLATDVAYRAIGYLGPSLQVTGTDNNTFGRGVRTKLLTELQAGWQVVAMQFPTLGNQAYQARVGLRMELPTRLSALGLPIWRSYNSATELALNYRLAHHPRYYQLRSIDAAAAFAWQPNEDTQLRWAIAQGEYFYLAQTTALFEEQRTAKPLFARSFEPKLVLGGSFEIENTTQPSKQTGHRWQLRIESAGNLLNLSRMVSDGLPWAHRPQRNLWGIDYAQYLLAEASYASRHALGHRASLAYRVAVGAGWAVGNSQVLPYTKQFFVGGVSSVRAFKLRSFGPGAVSRDELAYFSEQTGDLKLELSLEYRRHLDPMFELAAFVDAGNVWLSQTDAERPEGHFVVSKFVEQLAFGPGLGLRFDTGFVLLRLDGAIALRNPSLPGKSYWTLHPTNAAYRAYLPRFNFAVGYPF